MVSWCSLENHRCGFGLTMSNILNEVYTGDLLIVMVISCSVTEANKLWFTVSRETRFLDVFGCMPLMTVPKH